MCIRDSTTTYTTYWNTSRTTTFVTSKNTSTAYTTYYNTSRTTTFNTSRATTFNTSRSTFSHNTSRSTAESRQTEYNTNTSKSTTTQYNTTACYTLYRGHSTVPKSFFGCMEETTTAVYSTSAWVNFGVGSYLYTNSGCTSYISSGWWPISGNSSFGAAKVAYVGAGGLVTNIISC